MPSQDDYLDELLKGISSKENEGNAEERSAAGPGAQEPESLDLDAVTNMTEEDIARLLAAGAEETANDNGTPPSSTEEGESLEDVLAMLEGTKDDDLQEIQDMLQKSDNNESVAGNEVSEEEENPANQLLADIEDAENGTEALNPKQQRALEKKRRKEEKLAQKAEKKARREAAKASKSKKGRTQEEQDFDKDVLDSIVSGAGQIGHKSAQSSEEEGKPAEEAIIEIDTEEADNLIPDITAMAEAEEEESEVKEPEVKGGFLSKFLAFLMEEEEEEPENEDIRLSKENQDILDELDKEKAGAKGGKGKKKEKKAKPKKEPKPKKAPKPKKEKPPKEKEPTPPGSRLSLKKVLPIVLLGATVGAVILIFVNVSVDYADKRAAKEAYYEGDYQTAYQNLFGKKMNEEEAMIYGKSESILYIKRMLRKYEMFIEEGSEVKALDSLIQTVNDYPAFYEYASQWDAAAEVGAVYSNILTTLYDRYGITESQALEIAAVKSDLEYTRIVTRLARGESYDSWSAGTRQPSGENMPNELPEESDIGQGNLVDNQ